MKKTIALPVVRRREEVEVKRRTTKLSQTCEAELKEGATTRLLRCRPRGCVVVCVVLSAMPLADFGWMGRLRIFCPLKLQSAEHAQRTAYR